MYFICLTYFSYIVNTKRLMCVITWVEVAVLQEEWMCVITAIIITQKAETSEPVIL